MALGFQTQDCTETEDMPRPLIPETSPAQSGKVNEAFHDTLFSTWHFANAWVKAFPERDDILPIAVTGSGRPRNMYSIQTPAGFGTRSVSAGHPDLYSSPGWEGVLERETVKGILNQITPWPTRRLTWRVRFDHGPLAQILQSCGLSARPQVTQIIHLQQSYETTLGGYSATTRNHIRKAHRRGLVIREARSIEDLSASQEIYSALALEKGWHFMYPLELSSQLAAQPAIARFFVAEFEGRIVGGALFVRDGCSVLYLIGATDRCYATLYPAPALIDAGVRWAYDVSATFLNMGPSGSNASLAQFKSSFGCCDEADWIFHWENDMVARLKAIRRAAANGINRLGVYAGQRSSRITGIARQGPTALDDLVRTSFDGVLSRRYQCRGQ